jgi:Xaa-Pro aminopeptidase
MEYKIDTSFTGKPHECEPHRLYSQTGADWQYRVDFDRLRRDRLQKAKEQMNKHDLGALVLFAGANIRYVTGSYQGNWKYNINIRYAVLPNGGEPVLKQPARTLCAKWIFPGCRPHTTRHDWQWAEGAVPHMAGKMADDVLGC